MTTVILDIQSNVTMTGVLWLYHPSSHENFQRLMEHIGNRNDIFPIKKPKVEFIKIAISNTDDGSIYEINIATCFHLGGLINAYKLDRNKKEKFSAFQHNSQTYFIGRVKVTEVGKLGFQDGDTIYISKICDKQTSEQNALKVKSKKKKLTTPKNNSAAKIFKRKSLSVMVAMKQEPDYRNKHSEQQDRVINEMREPFKNIREGLYAMNIKKDPPKKRAPGDKADRMENSSESLQENSSSFGGKAGKVVYPVLVSGDKQYLYRTGKQRCHNEIIKLDLHGHSKITALEKLNESLEIWIEKAMTMQDQFVIAVNIICRGGNQVISEVVAKWIYDNPTVANRPKVH